MKDYVFQKRVRIKEHMMDFDPVRMPRCYLCALCSGRFDKPMRVEAVRVALAPRAAVWRSSAVPAR